jgi:hypothetical protein
VRLANWTTLIKILCSVTLEMASNVSSVLNADRAYVKHDVASRLLLLISLTLPALPTWFYSP